MKNLIFIFTLLLSSTAFAYNFASPSDPSAKVILDHSIAAKQIFPVRLLMVNGENVNVRSQAVWLEPGEYELKFGSVINGDYTQQVLTPRQRRGIADWNTTLRLKVEADKSYYIGFDASSTDTEEWHTVVYDVQ